MGFMGDIRRHFERKKSLEVELTYTELPTGKFRINVRLPSDEEAFRMWEKRRLTLSVLNFKDRKERLVDLSPSASFLPFCQQRISDERVPRSSGKYEKLPKKHHSSAWPEKISEERLIHRTEGSSRHSHKLHSSSHHARYEDSYSESSRSRSRGGERGYQSRHAYEPKAPSVSKGHRGYPEKEIYEEMWDPRRRRPSVSVEKPVKKEHHYRQSVSRSRSAEKSKKYARFDPICKAFLSQSVFVF